MPGFYSKLLAIIILWLKKSWKLQTLQSSLFSWSWPVNGVLRVIEKDGSSSRLCLILCHVLEIFLPSSQLYFTRKSYSLGDLWPTMIAGPFVFLSSNSLVYNFYLWDCCSFQRDLCGRTFKGVALNNLDPFITTIRHQTLVLQARQQRVCLWENNRNGHNQRGKLVLLEQQCWLRKENN